MLARCGCFEKLKKFLEMTICGEGQVIYGVKVFFPPVALRFPLRLDNSSQKQFKYAAARIYGSLNVLLSFSQITTLNRALRC